MDIQLIKKVYRTNSFITKAGEAIQIDDLIESILLFTDN